MDTDPQSRFDEMYERVGAAKAYYMACAFTASNDIDELWSALRMLRACTGLDLCNYIGGYIFPEEDSNGMSEGQYDVWRVEAWTFREYMEERPVLMGWKVQL